jgi:hypothetical protein
MYVVETFSSFVCSWDDRSSHSHPLLRVTCVACVPPRCSTSKNDISLISTCFSIYNTPNSIPNTLIFSTQSHISAAHHNRLTQSHISALPATASRYGVDWMPGTTIAASASFCLTQSHISALPATASRYGVDWMPGTTIAASASFYDHRLEFWRMNAECTALI